MECAAELTRRADPNDKLKGADMWVEAATDPSLDIIRKQEMLDRGESALKQIKLRPGFTSPEAIIVGGRASLRLASFGMMRWFVCGDMIPPRKEIETAYELTARAAQLNADYFLERWGDDYIEPRLAGNLSEAHIQMLDLRSELENGTGDRVSLFSFYSQSHANHPGSHNVGRWDISIYDRQDAEQPPALDYRIQVRTRKNGQGNGVIYDRSKVATVHAIDDLRLPGEALRVTTITGECFAEVNGTATSAITDRLDMRGSLLLDALDR